MEINYNDLVDNNLVDDCEQIRNVSKKTWLSGAAVSLAHLDNVKTNVYNFGISDPRDLKATNLRSRKQAPAVGPDPPPSATSSQHSHTAWGSNSSIPDLLRQQNLERATLPKPQRPASAKYSNTRQRPPSGKRPRPQSAKEPTPDIVSEETKPGFGVKGARYDPNGRPPKGIPYATTTGWVGPPAGLKYPDKPPPGSGWKIEFPPEPPEVDEGGGGDYVRGEREVPPPPCTTPIPPTPEPEKPKRVFELYIGDPYSVSGQSEDEDLYEDSDDELAYIQDHSYNDTSITESSANQSGHHTHQPYNSAPGVGMAPLKESMRLDLPTADDDFDEIDEVDTDRLLAEAESVSKALNLKSIIHVNKNIPDTSSHDSKPVEKDLNGHTDLKSDDVSDAANRKRAEHLVNDIITENGLAFNEDNESVERSRKPVLEHEKSSVKFKDDVTTVSITPRNIGRKVDELHGKKKMPVSDSSFIDLIEVKNRMEPVLSTGKMDMSPRRSRPPSGKSKPPKQTMTTGLGGVGKQVDRPVSPNHCLRNHTNPPRPKSGEPLNRAPKAVTTVTVDYGIDEEKDNLTKPKKKKKRPDDIVTMMEKINMQDNDRVPTINLQDFEGLGESKSENIHETKYKSEPVKNYYEISRHSSMSNATTEDGRGISRTPVPSTPATTVVKTTKTIEFDKEQPKEIKVKNVLDAQVVHKETKEFIVRPPSRPTSAKPPAKKPATTEEPSERPGSRIGFVAMAPSGSKENQNRTKPPSRPSSASSHHRPSSANKAKPEKTTSRKTPTAGGDNLTRAEKQEREAVIDNLLERTRGLLDGAESKETASTTSTPPAAEPLQRRKARPTSAHVGNLSRAKEPSPCRNAVTKRPASASTTRLNHKHSHSNRPSSGTRKSSGKAKTIYTEPCIITTNTPYLDDESETEEDLACQEMHEKLKAKGVNIAPDTLQRALYPPSGRTKYYHISADLPQKSSIQLLSHPRAWLGEEYRRLQKAEKTLDRANEMMFLQERAEKRRAMLEALGPEERKKMLKKKGKKGTKKLRKSKTIA